MMLFASFDKILTAIFFIISYPKSTPTSAITTKLNLCHSSEFEHIKWTPPIIPRKTRGINKIQDLPAGEVVEFNRLGQAVGKWQNLYGKYIGTRTRRLISMNIEDWKHVTKEQKDFLWLDIKDVKRKAEHRKELNDLKPAIMLHRPKSVLNGYNRWMSRGNDCVEPYNLHVGKEVFRQVEDSYFAINPTDIIELLTNKKLELGILTCFEMSLYQLKGCSQQNKVGFLHPELITPDVYGANRGATLDYLARALEGYEFAPYLQGGHYVLFIICPKHGRGFILDSLKASVFHSDDEYMLAGLVDSVLGDSLKWELPIVNRQPGEWECGYYVMKWMQDFVLKYQNDNFPNTIPWGEDRRLENTELDAVIGAWFTLWRG